jgi:hypothetical protein
MTDSSETEKSLPEDVRIALAAYRENRSAARWTALSQLWVGDVQVLDALKLNDPYFPSPLPLPVDGIVEDSSEFFQWPVLPDADDVLHALAALGRKQL